MEGKNGERWFVDFSNGVVFNSLTGYMDDFKNMMIKLGQVHRFYIQHGVSITTINEETITGIGSNQRSIYHAELKAPSGCSTHCSTLWDSSLKRIHTKITDILKRSQKEDLITSVVINKYKVKHYKSI